MRRYRSKRRGRRRVLLVSGALLLAGGVVVGGIALAVERARSSTAPGDPAGGGDPSAGLSPYCRLVLELDQKSPSFQLLASGERARIRARVREWVVLTRSARAKSPPEIRRHVETLAAASLEFARLLERHDYDLDAMAEDPEVRRLEAPRRERRLASAHARVGAYNQEHCRLDGRET